MSYRSEFNPSIDTVILDAVRTPIGRFRGSLSDVRADHLASALLQRLSERTGIDGEVVNDVVLGCVTQVGEQCGNIARTALLGAGWPTNIPGMTVDRKCGSSEAAIHVAAAQIWSGVSTVVVAGGAESMSRVPMGGNRDVHGDPFGWRVLERAELVSQGEAAERIADMWGFSRSELDEFAVNSHRRAARAAESGYFENEIEPVTLRDWSESRAPEEAVIFDKDETIRPQTNAEKLSELKSVFRPDGKMTAGNSSQISDGAAVLLLASAEFAKHNGLKQRARIRSVATVGSDPTLMLTGPIEATRQALHKAGLNAADIDLFEVNEAFAPVPLMWMAETGAAEDKTNVNGGAIALGHPLGASGARIMTSLLNELERRDATFGLQTVCCAGGLATATIIERFE
ncbi:thiolase family protein [Hyphococcus sp.]|uniref:thiolase family protein n=1 Tax=Hyphococcus sp. TaxID=2038636 RepID=UPI003CCC2207